MVNAASFQPGMAPGSFLDEMRPAEEYPIQFFVRGNSYSLFGLLASDVHLFGVQRPARIMLLGAPTASAAANSPVCCSVARSHLRLVCSRRYSRWQQQL